MKVKQTMLVHKHIEEWMGKEPMLFMTDMSEHGYVLLGEVEVEYEVPDIDIRAAQVEALDKQITKTRAEFERKLMALTEQKNNLLALGVEG